MELLKRILDGFLGYIAERKLTIKGLKYPAIKRITTFHRIHVCLLHFDARIFESSRDLLNFIYRSIRNSLFQIDLLVLPPSFGTSLLGAIPFLNKHFYFESGTMYVERFQELLSERFINMMKWFSKELGISIVSGGVDTESKMTVQVYNRGDLLYNRDILREEPEVMELDGYKLVVLNEEEAKDFRTIRHFMEREVYIYIVYSKKSNENLWEDKLDIWARSQSLGVYGIKSSLSGRIFGKVYRGRSVITAPIPLTPNLDGYLARSDLMGAAKLTAILDISKLVSYLKNYENGYERYWKLLKQRK